MKFTNKTILVAIVVIFAGGLVLSNVMGWWKSESEKIPAKFLSGDFEGQYNPEDIRGSYAFGDIVTYFDVSLEDLGAAFGVTGDIAAFACKDLEDFYTGLSDDYEIGTDSVRLFVARYTGLPYSPESDSRLPATAVQLLKDKVDSEEFAFLESIAINLKDLSPVGAFQAEEHVYDASEAIVRGKTTFGEVLSFGITQDQIEEVLGMSMGSRVQSVRDFCVSNGIPFSTVKQAIDGLLAAAE